MVTTIIAALIVGGLIGYYIRHFIAVGDATRATDYFVTEFHRLQTDLDNAQSALASAIAPKPKKAKMTTAQ